MAIERAELQLRQCVSRCGIGLSALSAFGYTTAPFCRVLDTVLFVLATCLQFVLRQSACLFAAMLLAVSIARAAVEPHVVRDEIIGDAVMIDSAGETVWEQEPVGPPMGYAQQTPQAHATDWPAMQGAQEPFSWQLLPTGLIYRSYLAGVKESRFAGAMNYSDDRTGWLLDVTLGGRVGIVRFGTEDNLRPDGWQLDIEGAAFPRIDLEQESWDLESADFRFGVPLTYGYGPYQMKIAYYHLSSHAGDELLLNNPGLTRINYSRDAIVWGHSYYVTDAFRVYGEAGWAYQADGGSEPWELQYGFEYSPAWPTGMYGAPFFAANGHLREEVDFGGNAVVQAGVQWRGRTSSRLLRAGVQYFNGHTAQYQFFRRSEELIGLALWYDY
jgi:hypothetical protein